jgi:hypothetical protein
VMNETTAAGRILPDLFEPAYFSLSYVASISAFKTLVLA